MYGTRPEAIKCAPAIQALHEAHDFHVTPIFTGQHSEEHIHPITDLFSFREASNLNVLAQNNTNLNYLGERLLTSIDSAFTSYQPDVVLAQGDTTTVAITALAAYNRKIPFVHLEAGLRTSDLFSPHPEEGNRRLVTHLTSLHCAPTQHAKKNLLAENIAEDTIVVTGNTVIDALQHTLHQPLPKEKHTLLARNGLLDSSPILVTVHRRENWNELSQIGEALATIARQFPKYTIAYTAHPNPRIHQKLEEAINDTPNIVATPPLDYHTFSYLLQASHLVLTDSGGLQEEAPALGKPVLVMREMTERPEAVQEGTVRVIGNTTTAIVDNVTELLTQPNSYKTMSQATNPYGDGKAAERVVDALRYFLKKTPKPADFQP